MKKTIATLLTLVMFVFAFASSFSAFAASEYTVDSIVDKLSESAIYHYVEGDVTNLAKSVELNDDQLDKLYDVAERFVALGIEDKGASAHLYTKDEISAVVALVEEACDILNYKYEFVDSSSAGHSNDIVFKVYDESNKLVYSYDGDAVNQTGTDNSMLFVAVIAAGCALLVAAVAVAVKTKKKAI